MAFFVLFFRIETTKGEISQRLIHFPAKAGTNEGVAFEYDRVQWVKVVFRSLLSPKSIHF